MLGWLKERAMNKFALRLGYIGVLTVLSAVAASSAGAGNFSPNISMSASVQGSTQSINPGGGRPADVGYGYGTGGPAPPPYTGPKPRTHFFDPNLQFSGAGDNKNSTNGLSLKGSK
jgi:hypothetical protein